MKELRTFIFVFILLSCSKGDDTSNNDLDPVIPLSMKGNYFGDCFSVTKNHTGQIGGYSEVFDTIINSELTIIDAIPVTELYHKVTATGDCLSWNEFLADNKEYKSDTVIISDDDGHDYLELKWIQSEKKIILYYLDWSIYVYPRTYFTGTFQLQQ